MGHDERVVVAHPRRGSTQVVEDWLAKKRFVAGAVDVAQLRHRPTSNVVVAEVKSPLDIVLASSHGGGNSFSVRGPPTVRAKVGLHK